jgi:hypothetical protein
MQCAPPLTSRFLSLHSPPDVVAAFLTDAKRNIILGLPRHAGSTSPG